ncbi:MAG: bifunctional aldolase/short-chain dehydrogenase [Thiotrichales bacterium]|nr:MAG: bifunctional aldolase/short-chain dehydrogenase [Thiotrichales bacterium]
MKSLWSEASAAECADDPLQLRVYSSRLLGAEADLVLHGGGNTSVKIMEHDLFGDDEEILYVKGSGWDLGSIEAEGFAPVKLKTLRYMAGLEQLSDTDMVRLQRAAMTDPYAPNPSVEAVLHAIIPFSYVDHTHADAVVTITNSPNGEDVIRQLYGDRVLIVPYVMPGFILAKQIYQMTEQLDWSKFDGMVLMNHGVFTFDDDARRSYEKMIDLVSVAEQYIERHVEAGIADDGNSNDGLSQDDLLTLARTRRQVAEQRGSAVYALYDQDSNARTFAQRDDVDRIATRGPLTPDHIIRTKQSPLIVPADADKENTAVSDFAAAYQAYYERNSSAQQRCLDLAPRWAVWKQHGLLAFGTSLKEAGIIRDISRHTIKAIRQAEQMGGWRALAEKDLFDMEYWELEQAKLGKHKTAPEFQGKIALVTGAASGIGKACVDALLEKGAAVAALDVNPDIDAMYNREDVLELICDVTRESELQQAVRATVTRFGGLDILVSNAGVFTANETIEDMSDETWRLSLDINLSSHQRLIKLGVPFLRLGIDPAIVIIASKNVPAPGPGAGAYSAAKAGLTQLARVAAFELGGDNIRVNTIHPNAVFDTGVWTDDMLQGRAESYGMSVDEYKANNVLHTAVTSANVADMVCAMAGNSFAKTTGAQVPVDGGNERVI